MNGITNKPPAVDVIFHNSGGGIMTKVMIYDKEGRRLPDYLSILGECLSLGCTEINYTIYKIIETKPDAILADWHESDGNKLIEEMSKLRMDMPPIILMSPLNNQRRKEDALKLALDRGAYGFLPRPFTRQQFFQELQTAIERQKEDKPKFIDINGVGIGDDHFLELIADVPMISLSEHIGGIGKLLEILDRHNVLEDPQNRRKVYELLTKWGKLPPGEQIIEAAEYCVSSEKIRKDPVMAAICDLAQEILFGEEVTGPGKKG